MTHFALHDEEGRIRQSNKVYDPTGYADRLRALGHKFVESNHAQPISHEHAFVRNGAFSDRPKMRVKCSRREIKAGGKDVAIFTGIMPATKMTISTGGMVVWDDIAPAQRIDLPIPVPCVYKVRFEKWPFRTREFEVRAIE